MDGEVAEAGKSVCKSVVRSVVSMVAMLMLIWVVHNGYTLATKAGFVETGNSEDSYIALVFGIVTVVFGLIYFIIGLTIVAELAVDLLAWLKQKNSGASNNGEKEQVTICQIFIHTLALMASMFMLTWAIYYGYKLAAEAQNVVIYDRLAFLIGIISMAFGFIYFVIGMAIVADSALHLSGRLQQEGAQSEFLLDKQTEVILEV